MSPTVHSHVDTAERVAVITTEFDQPIEAVWTLFSDPTKLARWWGPPGMPMTVEHHDLQPGGTVIVTVATGGGNIQGRWTIHDVDAPGLLTFTFQSDGLDAAEIRIDIAAVSATSAAMTLTARFASPDAIRHALDIGFVDGVARSCAAAQEVVAAR